MSSTEAGSSADAATSTEAGATCSSASQCAGYNCYPGGVYTGCGGPALTIDMIGCTVDGDCADAGLGRVCVSTPCVSAPFTGLCAPGCTGAADCGAGETCQAGHCIATPCSTDAECITNFTCDPASHGCHVKACQTDSQCTGFCVNNLCSTQPGACEGAPS